MPRNAGVSHSATLGLEAAADVRTATIGCQWDCEPGGGSSTRCCPEEQYSLLEAVGKLFDSTILSNDALRPLADAWCRLSEGNLLRAGATVWPLRAAAESLSGDQSQLQRLAAVMQALWGGAKTRQVTSVSSDGVAAGLRLGVMPG